MLIVISPAKTLDYSESSVEALDSPKFRKQSLELVGILKEKSVAQLKSMMSISDSLAELNHSRYQNYSSRFTYHNSKAALLAFKGDVYLGLDAESLDQKDLEYAQDHLRILSGLYGVLKPLDKMQPYRLEMGTSLKNAQGNNLYDFWDDAITKELNKALKDQKDKVLVNLASNEYFKSVKKDKLKGEILDIQFKEYRDGKLKFLSFNAKKARGLMSRYIIQNRVEHKDKLKAFNLDNYYFNEELSSESNYVFVR